MRLFYFVLIISLCFSSCNRSNGAFTSVSIGDCNDLGNFKSYDEAISKIKATAFKISESVDTDKSSWVRGASYYSCDALTGYLIIETISKEYIHASMPVSVWNGFKTANSFGSYYDHNIKGRYRFNLSAK